MPSRWSISCWRARARNPRAVIIWGLFAASRYWHVTCAARVSEPPTFGKLRQPSLSRWLPDFATISGLNRTSGIAIGALNASSSGSSQPAGMSMTHIRSVRPTCSAASPTPRAACIVSTMSAASARSRSSTTATGCAFSRRTFSPYLYILSFKVSKSKVDQRPSPTTIDSRLTTNDYRLTTRPPSSRSRPRRGRSRRRPSSRRSAAE